MEIPIEILIINGPERNDLMADKYGEPDYKNDKEKTFIEFALRLKWLQEVTDHEWHKYLATRFN